MSEGQVTIVVGPSGVGKTAGRVQWLLEEFFPRPHLGVLVTNIPLRVDVIAERFDLLHARGKSEVTGDDVRSRIIVIPDDWRDGWVRRDPAYEPLKCLEGLDGAYRIVLDECQFYFGADAPIEWQMRFLEFINTARHGGGRVELMTQTFDGIPAKVRSSAEVEITTISAKVKRDGWINIPFSEWYNLRASIVRRWASAVWFIEHINVGGKKRSENSVRRYVLDEQIFQYYGSNDAVEGSTKAVRIPEDWEQYTRGQMVRRFLSKHWLKMVFSRPMLMVVLLYCAVGGPLSWASGTLFRRLPVYVESVVSGGLKKRPGLKEVGVDGLSSAGELDESASGAIVFEELPADVGFEQKTLQDVVTLITANGVWCNGQMWSVGESLPSGAVVESVDWLRGRVVTDLGLLTIQGSGGHAASVETSVRRNEKRGAGDEKTGSGVRPSR